MAIEFKDVARALSCKEFAAAELTVNRSGRVPCPFHGGTHGNLAVYDFDRGGRCHCFQCGRTADVVQLAAAVWHVSQVEAAEMLNERFCLGLDDAKATAEDRERWRQDRQRREDRHQAAEDALAEAEDEARRAWAAVEAAGPDSTEYDELKRQADNADLWRRFKAMELEQMTAGRC